ncbi:MAG TPA: hypothetical protein VLC92_13700 [Rhodocyclaceae bacterium]|nr:hypothetical protein [Rhodocyclaceae bacterium]
MSACLRGDERVWHDSKKRRAQVLADIPAGTWARHMMLGPRHGEAVLANPIEFGQVRFELGESETALVLLLRFVIPAKAGIHYGRVDLDPGLRRDDEVFSFATLK